MSREIACCSCEDDYDQFNQLDCSDGFVACACFQCSQMCYGFPCCVDFCDDCCECCIAKKGYYGKIEYYDVKKSAANLKLTLSLILFGACYLCGLQLPI